MPNKKLHIKLVKSPIGNQIRAKRTLKALGIHKMNQIVSQPDNDSVRGMLYFISHLVLVQEVQE